MRQHVSYTFNFLIKFHLMSYLTIIDWNHQTITHFDKIYIYTFGNLSILRPFQLHRAYQTVLSNKHELYQSIISTNTSSRQ